MKTSYKSSKDKKKFPASYNISVEWCTKQKSTFPL